MTQSLPSGCLSAWLKSTPPGTGKVSCLPPRGAEFRDEEDDRPKLDPDEDLGELAKDELPDDDPNEDPDETDELPKLDPDDGLGEKLDDTEPPKDEIPEDDPKLEPEEELPKLDPDEELGEKLEPPKEELPEEDPKLDPDEKPEDPKEGEEELD